VNRTVTLDLVSPAGEPLGTLPPFDVATPWWQEVDAVVAAARERYGLSVTILRLVRAARPGPPGGHVTYQAEVSSSLPMAVPLNAPKPDEIPSLRAPWAVPGGPAASVSWALTALREAGLDASSATQIRTWNLSALWRLDAAGSSSVSDTSRVSDFSGGPGASSVPDISGASGASGVSGGAGSGAVAWLKQVPGFLGHEVAVLRLVAEVAPGLVPTVLAAGEAGRSLLAHVPGEDRYEADAGFRLAIAEAFHPVQAHFAAATPELIEAGVPDRRRDLDRLARVAEPWLDTIDGLADLVDELPARLAAVAACGLPDTLVHGDLHPGNVRSARDRTPRRLPAPGLPAPGLPVPGRSSPGRWDPGSGLVIVDWGDSMAGHPAHDILRLADGLSDPRPLIGEWARWWREAHPGSDPEAAVELIRPVTALHAAAQYQDFLDHIEPSEHPYHRDDVPDRLAAAVAMARPDPAQQRRRTLRPQPTT
jgi:hypothetical protein